jgi:cell fate regulator YaaT (PSP1 superfamily)
MDEAGRSFVSVKYSRVGRVHSVSLPEHASDPPPEAGAQVVVRTSSGPALATVVRTPPALAPRRRPPAEAATVARSASREDLAARQRHEQLERAAHQFCLLKVRERGLAMKLTRVEQQADGTRLIFYFTADGRIDFRELVRDLAAEFRTRIEMRQIGVRDEARMLGGYGGCGRPLCCTTFLQSFEPVSIKMAKQLKLSLNPSKLSGLCGRLKCCLRYELPEGKGEGGGGCARGGGAGDGEGCAGCGCR